MWGRGGSKPGVADKSTFRDWRRQCLDQAIQTATLLTANISMSTDLSRRLDPPPSYIQQQLRWRGEVRFKLSVDGWDMEHPEGPCLTNPEPFPTADDTLQQQTRTDLTHHSQRHASVPPCDADFADEPLRAR